MKKLLVLIVVIANAAFAQPLEKSGNKMKESLEKSVRFLADDKLEGRRTGTAGEKLAYEYISKQFKKAGLKPITANPGYLQPFEVKEGKEIAANSSMSIGNNQLVLYTDYFPLAYSANATGLNKGFVSLDLAKILVDNKDNPHFDLHEYIMTATRDAAVKGAAAVLIHNSSSIKDELKFDEKDKHPVLPIPVIYISAKTAENYLNNNPGLDNIRLNIELAAKKRTGHNVIGFINNNAPTTIILGAHYDHLGYGEDHNSLYSGSTKMIHNGADDNASGTAALIELGRWLKRSGLKNHNYLLLAFSGEELGLYGSKYFTEHSPIDLASVNYMINMDMIGRLNDSTRGITIGGYGTSPRWAQLINTQDPYFKIKLDSSGSGPSDHTSFYRKDIPVLFFFTGTHSDYHKPTDDADKINIKGTMAVIQYIQGILKATDSPGKLAFTKTREVSMGKTSFKVSLGIMPDYTFSGTGVLVDGISEGKAAQKAGIRAGDIIYQLGEHKITDVQTYMGALNKFNKGEATTVKLKRGTEDLVIPVVF